MPYRNKLTRPSGTGELVTYRSYLDPIRAKLDAARLMDEGIETHLFDEGAHNVVVSGGFHGGVRLQVRQGDLERVMELLDERPEEQPRDDGEEVGAVRCPRCELAYCFHERVRLEGSSAATALTFFAAPLMLFLRKRWHCHKCGHMWDDPKAGPAEMTRLADDDPTPIFRLRRAHGGMGLFLGLLVGGFAALLATTLPPDVRVFVTRVAWVVCPFLGWLVGCAWTYDLCSEPTCRTPLPRDREDCPRCKGVIGGVIRSAEEHYAAAADVRRELAALHAQGVAPDKKKRGKKKGRPGALPSGTRRALPE